jgi:hypothetical protein
MRIWFQSEGEGVNGLYRRAYGAASRLFTLVALPRPRSTPHGRRNTEAVSAAITSQGGGSTVKRGSYDGR